MTPVAPDGDERWARMTFTKTWTGELQGTGRGLMISAGDPGAGNAGYVAVETVDGALDGRSGGLALQQFGALDAGAPHQQYVVVPGSGSGALQGVRGTLVLTVDDDGTHRYDLEYTLP